MFLVITELRQIYKVLLLNTSMSASNKENWKDQVVYDGIRASSATSSIETLDKAMLALHNLYSVNTGIMSSMQVQLSNKSKGSVEIIISGCSGIELRAGANPKDAYFLRNASRAGVVIYNKEPNGEKPDEELTTAYTFLYDGQEDKEFRRVSVSKVGEQKSVPRVIKASSLEVELETSGSRIFHHLND